MSTGEDMWASLDRELVRRFGFAKFLQLAWHVVEPAAKFISSWHIEAIAAHLEAVSRGEIRNLVINVPPGCSKSVITSVLWPAWVWTFEPQHRWMAATHGATLARRDALKMRQLVRSKWYQDRWPDTKINDGGDVQDTMGVYHTVAGGFRFSTTVGGEAIGWHCHTQILDDPIKPEDLNAEPETARAVLGRVWEWWRGTMASRQVDPSRFSRVVIMQRLHEDDLAARCIEEGYVHLMLPMRFDVGRACGSRWFSDPRTSDGELLCPSRFDEQAVSATETTMGARVASAQLQQRPAPAEGNIFQRSWLSCEYTELPANLNYVQSWDCAFKDTGNADFVAGQIWGHADGKFYLVDRCHRRMGLPETVAAVKKWSVDHPKAYTKLIEDKANGPAVEQMLRHEMTGLVMLEPKTLGGSKTARANAVAALFEAGNVLVPSASKCPWIEAWREEMASFPFAKNDDDVDATTQALIYLQGKSNTRYLRAMENLAKESR